MFRNLLIKTLVDHKLLSKNKADQLLSWKNSGFSIDPGVAPTLPFDRKARRQFAEYMLRAPFSLEKIHWNENAQKVIYRSKRSWHTKQNYKIYSAADFIAASIEHIAPKGQQTIRYYGRYSNKRRGWDRKNRTGSPTLVQLVENTNHKANRETVQKPNKKTLFQLPEKAPKNKTSQKPDWKSLIKKIWGGDPMTCPCCKSQMKNAGTILRKEEIQFFLRLWGLWEGIKSLPPPPDPPFNIETLEPEILPRGWEIPEEHLPPPDEWWHQHDSEVWRNPELPLDDEGRVLVLDAEPLPAEEFPVFSIG